MTFDSPAAEALPIEPAAPADAGPWPSPGRAWYAVFVFTLVLMINFLDRGIVGLLMPGIKGDLHLSDVQMSYLVGFAFILIYVFVGLPVARWADVGPRRAIVGIGIGLWSLATAFCGIAQNFWQLFACRVATGVGKSCGGPATYSMLSDLFPREKLPRAIAVMSFGFTVGTGLSLIVGGAVLDLIRQMPPFTLPGFGTLKSWQTAFLFVGIPGLIVSALCWTVKEPARRGRALKGARLQSAPIRTIVGYLFANWKVYGPMLLGLAFNTTHAIGTLIWMPTFYARTYGWDPAMVGIFSGLALIFVWPLGSVFGSFLAERWAKQGKDDANLRVVVWAMFLLIPGQISVSTDAERMAGARRERGERIYRRLVAGAAERGDPGGDAERNARPGHRASDLHDQYFRLRPWTDASGADDDVCFRRRRKSALFAVAVVGRAGTAGGADHSLRVEALRGRAGARAQTVGLGRRWNTLKARLRSSPAAHRASGWAWRGRSPMPE